MKYLGINILKYVQVPNTENYKMLLQEFKGDLQNRDTPSSWIRIFNIVKIKSIWNWFIDLIRVELRLQKVYWNPNPLVPVNVTLPENSHCRYNRVKIKSYWIRVGLNPI